MSSVAMQLKSALDLDPMIFAKASGMSTAAMLNSTVVADGVFSTPSWVGKIRQPMAQ